jgi:hypothetical protein
MQPARRASHRTLHRTLHRLAHVHVLVHVLVLGLGALLALASCTKEQPRQSASDPGSTTLPPPPGMAATPPEAKTAPTRPSATAPAAEPPGDAVSGTVVETMNSGGYTYARLDDAGKQVWVAGPETTLAVGTKIGKSTGMLMSAFKSTTLNRTFDQIYFISSFDIAGGAAPDPHGAGMAAGSAMPDPHGAGMAAGSAMPDPHGAGMAAGSAMPNPHGAGAPASPGAADKVERAPGGKTVAEVFASKDALSGKPVVVRGKVVKVNNGILGRNWVHLQDGTGAPGTNDLMVARGNVAINKDFGAGYSYPVLVEDAAIASK